VEALGLDRTFWEDRRVFLTGHTGFKGSWLALLLSRLGAKVVGYALPPETTPSLFECARVASVVESTFADVRDFQTLKRTLAAFQPEIIIHLAAQSLVRRSYREPIATYATNVMGTVHLLEAIRDVSSVRTVLNVTSDKCYENQEAAVAYVETDPMGGHDPYSSSKGCAELVTSAYRRSYFTHPESPRVASVRAGNVIGGGDWAEDRLVPDLMRAFANGESALIRNPGAMRPWQHVLDPLRGYLLLGEQLTLDPALCEGWNFGPDHCSPHSVGAVADMLAGFWSDSARWHTLTDAEGPHEAQHLALNSAKARDRLGWRPLIDLPNALELTSTWYRAHDAGSDMAAFTEAQISTFLDSDLEPARAVITDVD
jgi:CDP-glucose 4,6-dehydratase